MLSASACDASTSFGLSLSGPSASASPALIAAIIAARARAIPVLPTDLLAHLRLAPATENPLRCLVSRSSLLPVDLRPLPSYSRSHLNTAVSLSLAPVFKTRLRARPEAARRYALDRTVTDAQGGGSLVWENWRGGLNGDVSEGGRERMILVFDDMMDESDSAVDGDGWLMLLMLDRTIASASTPPASDTASIASASTTSDACQPVLPEDTKLAYLVGGWRAFAALDGAQEWIVGAEGEDNIESDDNATSTGGHGSRNASPAPGPQNSRRISTLSINTISARDRADRVREKAERRKSGNTLGITTGGAGRIGSRNSVVYQRLAGGDEDDGDNGGKRRARGATFSGLSVSANAAGKGVITAKRPASSNMVGGWEAEGEKEENWRPPRVSVVGKRPASANIAGSRGWEGDTEDQELSTRQPAKVVLSLPRPGRTGNGFGHKKGDSGGSSAPPMTPVSMTSDGGYFDDATSSRRLSAVRSGEPSVGMGSDMGSSFGGWPDIAGSPDSAGSAGTHFFRTPATLTASAAGSAVPPRDVLKCDGNEESDQWSDKLGVASENSVKLIESHREQVGKAWSPGTAVGLLAPDVFGFLDDPNLANENGEIMDGDQEFEEQDQEYNDHHARGYSTASGESTPTSDDEDHGPEMVDLYTQVLDNLYIGSDEIPSSSDGRDRMKELRVTHVLNVATEVTGMEAHQSDLCDAGFVCLKMHVKDNANEDMEKYLRQGIEFIGEATKHPEKRVYGFHLISVISHKTRNRS
ncbi:hypothetical protein HDU93_004534 [Gonapodya sp. JEL0774]|nr:hypothetical protein HDU93_004534 [Gonapodya sp. JEL0774]